MRTQPDTERNQLKLHTQLGSNQVGRLQEDGCNHSNTDQGRLLCKQMHPQLSRFRWDTRSSDHHSRSILLGIVWLCWHSLCQCCTNSQPNYKGSQLDRQ
jgi:hypothetical protein